MANLLLLWWWLLLWVCYSGPHEERRADGHHGALRYHLPPTTHRVRRTYRRTFVEHTCAHTAHCYGSKHEHMFRPSLPACAWLVADPRLPVVAMIHPSGCGKTTLIECLSLRNRDFEGALRLNHKVGIGGRDGRGRAAARL